MNENECAPPAACGCIGHRFPNVSHIAPCCNVPHITEEEFLDPEKNSSFESVDLGQALLEHLYDAKHVREENLGGLYD